MGWIKCRNFFTYYSPLTHWHIKTQLDWFWLILYTIWNKNINHYLNICTFFANLVNSFTNFGNVHFFRWFRNSAGYVKSAMLKNRNCPQRLMSQVGLFQISGKLSQFVLSSRERRRELAVTLLRPAVWKNKNWRKVIRGTWIHKTFYTYFTFYCE